MNNDVLDDNVILSAQRSTVLPGRYSKAELPFSNISKTRVAIESEGKANSAELNGGYIQRAAPAGQRRKYPISTSVQSMISVILCGMSVVLVVFGIFVVYFVETNIVFVLDSPKVVVDYDDMSIRWMPVNKTEGYMVVLNQNIIGLLSKDVLHIQLNGLMEGEYLCKLKAIGMGKTSDSDWSDDVRFAVEKSYDNIVLDTPTVSVVNDTLVWDSVTNASLYEVVTNGKTYHVYTNSFDMSGLDVGTYSLRVRAIGGRLLSDTKLVKV